MLENIDPHNFEYLTDGRDIYIKKDGRYIRLSIFDKHLYKLVLYGNIPILEIDGLRMQLVKDFETPLEYSQKVVKTLNIKKGEKVLDTCMGLGYTAAAAAKRNAEVTTFEISNAVVTLARLNPKNNGLFENKRIKIRKGNSFELIKDFEEGSFNCIIHDPPRLSHAGELYSSEFYHELKRVSKTNARLFHYVGNLGKRKGRDIANQVKKRLEKTGFRKIKKEEKLQGLVFRK